MPEVPEHVRISISLLASFVLCRIARYHGCGRLYISSPDAKARGKHVISRWPVVEGAAQVHSSDRCGSRCCCAYRCDPFPDRVVGQLYHYTTCQVSIPAMPHSTATGRLCWRNYTAQQSASRIVGAPPSCSQTTRVRGRAWELPSCSWGNSMTLQIRSGRCCGGAWCKRSPQLTHACVWLLAGELRNTKQAAPRPLTWHPQTKPALQAPSCARLLPVLTATCRTPRRRSANTKHHMAAHLRPSWRALCRWHPPRSACN